MADELEKPLRIGIGIHTGPAVVGRMGFGAAMYLTAVGDTVHVETVGGPLTVRLGEKNEMEGPARTVFTGSLVL